MKLKIGAVYLVALLVGSTQCGLAQNPQKGSQKPKSSSGWNSGLSNMMDQLESQVGPKKGSQPAAPPANPEGPGSSPPSMPPEPGTAGSSTETDTTAKPASDSNYQSTGSSVSTPGASQTDQSHDDDKPGAPAVVPMPPDDYQGLMPFGTGSSGTKKIETPAAGNATSSPPGSDSYISEIEKSGLTRWEKSRFPVKIYIEPSSSAKGFRPEFVSILTQSFKDWGKTIPAIPLEFVDNSTYAQIACTWTDNKSDLMSNLEGGNAIVIFDNLGMVRVDMKILTLPPSQFPTIPSNLMRHVALHEAGHALGLAGHSAQSSDIMFGTIYPKDESCNLSARDSKTLQTLYTMTISPSQRLDPTKRELIGDMNNPKVRAMKLGNDAAIALKEMRVDVAEAKLKEAHKLDPSNKMISGNLGGVYANLGTFAAMARNFPMARELYKQAVPLLEESNNKQALGQVLTNYAQILQGPANTAELKRIQTKLKNLKP